MPKRLLNNGFKFRITTIEKP
ncbi:hypothetical protein [Algibacter luteus]